MADSWGKSDIICSTYPKTAGDLPRRYNERAKAAEMLCRKVHLSPVRRLRDNEGPVAPDDDKCLTDAEMPGQARHDDVERTAVANIGTRVVRSREHFSRAGRPPIRRASADSAKGLRDRGCDDF